MGIIGTGSGIDRSAPAARPASRPLRATGQDGRRDQRNRVSGLGVLRRHGHAASGRRLPAGPVADARPRRGAGPRPGDVLAGAPVDPSLHARHQRTRVGLHDPAARHAAIVCGARDARRSRWTSTTSSTRCPRSRARPSTSPTRRCWTPWPRLPAGYQEVVLLADVEEFTYKEIATMLEVPLGTVMSRLHRARRLLRAALVERAAHHGMRPSAVGRAEGGRT